MVPSIKGNIMETYVLCASDCKTIFEGYHINVWDGICEAFGLDPQTTDDITIRYVDHEEVGSDHEEVGS